MQEQSQEQEINVEHRLRSELSGQSTFLDQNVRAQLDTLGISLAHDTIISRNLLCEQPCWLSNSTRVCRTQIGAYSYIQYQSSVTTSTIGRYCSIAHDCDIGLGQHHIDGITTSVATYSNHCFAKYSGQLPNPKWRIANNGEETNEVTIGNDVWIGAHVIIPSNVSVGHGAIIGAGAVITKDVPPYAVVVGNNRIIKQRFSDEVISDILKLNWWNYDIPRMLRRNIEILHAQEQLKNFSQADEATSFQDVTQEKKQQELQTLQNLANLPYFPLETEDVKQFIHDFTAIPEEYRIKLLNHQLYIQTFSPSLVRVFQVDSNTHFAQGGR